MIKNLSIKRVKPPQLSPADWALWTTMRTENSQLYSPYFHPAYTQLIDRLQNDVWIAVIKSDNQTIGFLPFQQRRIGGKARPVGAPMTDYHGIISEAPLVVNMSNLLSLAKISALQMPSQMNLAPSTPLEDQAICAVAKFSDYPSISVWREAHDSSYNRHLKSLRRRTKKIESEHGVRSFIWQSQDSRHFEKLIEWKRDKFKTTGKYDVLSVDWTLSLLRELWKNGPDAPLRCDLHVMMINDEPVAMDLGLSDGVTFHSWIVGYDSAFQSFSPGMQLLENLVDQSETLGYDIIDLGSGIEGYKKHYATWEQSAAACLWTGQGLGAKKANIYSRVEKIGQSHLKDIPGKFRRRFAQIEACDASISGQARAMWQAIKNGG